MQALNLLTHQLQPDNGHKRREDLEDNGLQIGQPWHKLFCHRVQRIRDSPGMCVQPEAVPLHAPSKVDLPDALEWQLIKVLIQRLAAVHTVAVNIVQIQEKPAVGGFDYASDKI